MKEHPYRRRLPLAPLSAEYTEHPEPPKPTMPAGGRIRIGRRIEFCAAHFLPLVSDSHKCHRMHGHNYDVAIEVEGPLDATLGWVADFDLLQVALDLCVRGRLDHMCLNEIPGLENPTSENLVLWVAQQLGTYFDGVPGLRLASVRAAERGNSWAHLELP